MRRFLFGLAVLLGGAASQASAQTRVRLEATVQPGTNAPLIRLWNLFDEPRWRQAMERSLPVRLHWRLQVWRSRPGWIDSPVSTHEWDVVIQREPLLEQYRLAVQLRGLRANVRSYPSLDALQLVYDQAQPVRGVAPTQVGEWYYRVNVEIETLNDEDFARMRRTADGSNPGGIGAAVGRMLFMFGLPNDRLNAQTTVFRVAPRG